MKNATFFPLIALTGCILGALGAPRPTASTTSTTSSAFFDKSSLWITDWKVKLPEIQNGNLLQPEGDTEAEEELPWTVYEMTEASEVCEALLAESWRLWNGPKRKDCEEALERYRGSERKWREIFEEEGVPGDLTLLCVVETLCRNGLTSSAGAAGVWQLMPATARAYGLKVNGRTDERLDPDKSARVAARILRDEHERFGSWGLAVASYNCGPGWVSRAKKATGNSESAWKTLKGCPRETQGYLPGLISVMRIKNNES